MAIQDTDLLYVQRPQGVDAGAYKIEYKDLASGNITTGDTAPDPAADGDLWYNSDDGRLYVYYTDVNSSQWVDASPDNQSWIVTVKDFGAVGDGTTDDTAAFQAALDNDDGVLYVPPGDYLIEGDVVTLARNSLVLAGRLLLRNSGTFTIYSSLIVVGDDQHFNYDLPSDLTTSPLKIRKAGSVDECNPNIKEVNPFWWNGNGIGDRTNRALRACGGRTKVKFPNGNIEYLNGGGIILNEDIVGTQITLEGSGGHLATTLVMPSNSPMIGVDAFKADEAVIRDLRVIEGSGSKVSCCFNIGGTSGIVDNCWAGNAKYGFMLRQTAGTQLNNLWSEFCNYGMVVCSNFADFSIPGLDDAGGSVINVIINSGLLYEGGEGNNSEDGGLLIGRARTLQVGSPTGTFNVGQTVTFSGGTTARIYATGSPAGTNQTWISYLDIDRNGNPPTTAQTLSTPTGSGNVAQIKQNLPSNIVASNLDVRKCKNYGARLFGAKNLSLNNCMFAINGSASATRGYGVDTAQQIVQFNGCIFSGNINNGSVDDRGANVGRDATATFTGCTFTDQTVGIRASAGGVTRTTSCIFNNVVTPKLGTTGTDSNSIGINSGAITFGSDLTTEDKIANAGFVGDELTEYLVDKIQERLES